MSSTKCLLIYKNVSVSIMSSVLSICGLDYSNSLWTPGLHTLHVYFLYHLTWCRAFIKLQNNMPTGGNSRTCQILLQLLSSEGQHNSNVKILPDLTKMIIYSTLTEKLYPIFCSQISIKHSSCRIVFNNLSRCLN
jgi:hypothetical protein